MNQDDQHLDLLAIFHYVVAGIMGFFSCLPIFHVGFGLAIIFGALDDGGKPVPALFGWMIAVMGSMFMLIGWTMAVFVLLAGRNLKRRRQRMFCLVVACCECLFHPFGTVLGVFTIIVLMRPSVQALFAANDALTAAK